MIEVFEGNQPRAPVESDSSSEDQASEATPRTDKFAQVVPMETSPDATDATEGNQNSFSLKKKSTLLSAKLGGAVASSRDPAGHRTVVEVRFEQNALIGECFESAIKAWRISEPNLINIEN